MKKIFFLIAAIFTQLSMLAAAPTYQYKFDENSVLAGGKWVTVKVSESGVHEISYANLRKMGFSDPSKVSVFGKGGKANSYNFYHVTSSKRYYEDNLKQVNSQHMGDKLYFYGEGMEDVSFRDNQTWYERKSYNIYSDFGLYYLTDSQPVREMPVATVANKTSAQFQDFGYGYNYYEKDVKQPTEGLGQVWIANDFKETPELIFPLSLKYYDSRQTLKCYVIANVAANTNTLDCNFIINEGSTPNERWFSLNTQSDKMLSNKLANFTIKDPANAKLKLYVSGNYRAMSTCALDNWVLTYPMTLANAKGDDTFDQQLVTYKAISGANALKVEVPEGCVAWDISNRTEPIALEVVGNYAYIPNPTFQSTIVVFDPKKDMISTGETFSIVENQNLHALAREKVDMVIISVESLVPYARQIAALHEQHDGLKVQIVTPEQLYKEFSAGIPDPMAYRAFCKLLYHNQENPLKHILLFGPIWSDVRNRNNVADRQEGLIAYQQGSMNLVTGSPFTVMDFYGMMGDYISSEVRPESTAVEVGVGILPIYNNEMAELAVAKIREYLEKDDFSWLVNETMSITCIGDAHAHDRQGEDIRKVLQNIQEESFDSHLSHRNVWAEQYGKDGARRMIKKMFNEGKLMSVYYGHAGRINIGTYFYDNDFQSLDNKDLGFMFFAGCELSIPAKGGGGIGENAVTKAKRGLVGSILSTRQVMSNFNYDLSAATFRALYKNVDGTLRTTTPTIGEIYAAGKTNTSNESENAYMLIGDPALRVPVGLGKIEIVAPTNPLRGGDVVEITGAVVNADGSVRSEYNGKVAVKVAEPEKSYYYQTINNTDERYMVFDDIRLAAVSGDVKDGKFKVKLVLPEKADNFRTGDVQVLPLYVSAYDPDLRLGTSGFSKLRLDSREGVADAPVKDTEAPSIELNYDNLMRELTVTVTDDTAVLPGIGAGTGTIMTIDEENVNLEDADSGRSGVASYQGKVNVATLAAGKHTYKIVATDMSGNSSTIKSGEFIIKDVEKLKLTANSKLAIENISFALAQEPVESLHLVICKTDGTPVLSQEVDGKEIECDVTGLENGLYRAMVRHNSAKGHLINSNWVEFSKID